MVIYDIQKSQHLLKSLIQDISFLNSLMSQMEVVSSNMLATWASINKSYDNFITDTEDGNNIYAMSNNISIQLKEIERLLSSIKEEKK